MTRTLAAGIDSSTQSCTVMLRRLEDGAVVAQARAAHPSTTPPCSEQDPRSWWAALEQAFADLKDYLPHIAAVSVGGQGHGLVLLDERDVPLRPAKLWNDTESAPDAVRLCQSLPPAAWAERTGSVPAPALTVSKLAWTERNHPGLVARAAHVMLPFDYIVYRLSGEAATERGGSSGTGYFNPFTNAWDSQLADLAVPGIDWKRILPSIIGSGAQAGKVSPLAGLKSLTGAVVGAGTGDNMTAALGMAVEEGDTVISLGTSGTIYSVTPIGIKDASGAINGYADATERFMPMVTTLNAAKVTDMFRRLLRLSPEEFDTLALSAPAGAEGVVLVPYLDGERTPNLPDATGRLLGLRSNMSAEILARAVMEGILCGLLDGGDLLSDCGVRQNGRLILTGGAARSRAYRQILADLTGRPVWTSPIVETAAAGAAVQAAAALNGATVADVANAWKPTLACVATPEANAAARAQEIRERYKETTRRDWEKTQA